MVTTFEEANYIVKRLKNFLEKHITNNTSKKDFLTYLDVFFFNCHVNIVVLDNMGNTAEGIFGARCYSDGEIDIYINRKKVGKILKNLNYLYKRITDVLIHELKHRYQFINIDEEIMENIFNRGSLNNAEEYYKDHFELDARAQDVAAGINSDIILSVYSTYFKGSKIYNKFLKKVYLYIEEFER